MKTMFKACVAAVLAAAASLTPATAYAQFLDHCPSTVEFTQASQASPTASTAHMTVRFTETVTYGSSGQPSCATQGAGGLLVTVNGVDRTQYFTEVWPPAGEHVVTWDAPALPLDMGSNQIGAFVNEASAYTTLTREGSSVTVSVAGASGPSTMAANSTATFGFTVTNTGNTSGSFTLACQSAGPITCGSVSPGSTTLAAGASVSVSVSATAASAAGSATLTLLASGSANGSGSRSTTVTIANPQTRVLVPELIPGTSIERSSCLAFSVGRDLATECGAMRVTHDLPMVRTLNTARSPTMFYYSDQVHGPVLPVHVILADTATIPDEVELRVFQRYGSSIGLNQTRTYPGSAWSTNRSQRVSFANWVGVETGIVPYAVHVRLRYGAQWKAATDTVSGEIAIVNRRGSRFGSGWWIAGIEQLYPGQSGGSVLWVGGDGSTRKYVSVGVVGSTERWVTETLDRPDTLYRNTATGAYERRLTSGVVVRFGATGLHESTTNLRGHVTRFVWTPAGIHPQLDSIVVPTPAGVHRAYSFRYLNGRLRKVMAPDTIRSVTLDRLVANGDTTNGVERITDPDGRFVRFEFASWAPGVAYHDRIDRRGTRTSFGHEWASPTIGVVQTVVSPTQTVEHRFRTVTGLAADANAAPVPVDSAYFRYDGPRLPSDTVDVSTFWLDRFGAPTRIVNAYGHTTVVKREQPGLPALVTRTESPVLADGRQRVQTATYDARGNVRTVTEVNPFGEDNANADAVTRYEYDNAAWPDFPTRIVPPEKDSTVISYRADGLREWQQDAVGSSTRVLFNYGNPYKLLSSSVLPGGARDSIEYGGAFGNLTKTRSPTGNNVVNVQHDSIGRDWFTSTLVDWAGPIYRTVETQFYPHTDNVYRTITTAPATSSAQGQQLFIESTYDEESNLKSVSRWSGVDAPTQAVGTTRQAIGRVTTRWDYDPVNRRTREYAPDQTPDNLADDLFDETEYDPAGNAVRRKSRRDSVVTTRYDALNRPVMVVIPQALYARRDGFLNAPPPGYSYYSSPDSERVSYPRYPTGIPGDARGYEVRRDTAFFAYDPLGNMWRADNGDALVRREFYANGMLRSETSTIRTIDRSDTTRHVYTLGYRYDLGGRRKELRHPSQLAPVSPLPGSQGVTRYGYAANGPLVNIIDPIGTGFWYYYNDRGEVYQWTRQRTGAMTSERFRFDDDGQVISDTLTDSPFNGSGVVYRAATFGYKPGGKLSWSRNPAIAGDTTAAKYDANGMVVESMTRNRRPSGEWSASRQFYKHDALGNIYENAGQQIYQTLDQPPLDGATVTGQRGYERGTGRLSWMEPDINQRWYRDTFHYDRAGNTEWQTTVRIPGGGDPVVTERASFYGHDGKLRAVDSRSRSWAAGKLKSTFEEYRYDALGRRVMVVTRKYCDDSSERPIECQLDVVRRTVWDGQQELYEIQMPLGFGQDPENDVAAIDVAPQLEPNGTGHRYDVNPHFGRVLYTHALGLDQPHTIIRIGYVSRVSTNQVVASTGVPFPAFAIIPFWEVGGQPSMGMFADSGKQSNCRTVSGSTHCVYLEWPARYLSYERQTGSFTSFWHGTLLFDKRDAAGLNYRRNRYYDPATGRFTQEDPIGLAGGLNVYGFAAGDPVNYSDPFGLCPIPASSCLGKAGLSLAVGFVPVVGDAVDIAGALVGRDLITGENIEGVARAATIVGTLVGSGRAARQAVEGATDVVGHLAKPPRGLGSVPHAQRDPKRVWTAAEREAKRQQQGGQCATGCGTAINQSNSRGHHIKRHADGGATNHANHAEVCVTCHGALHRPDE